MSKRFDFKLDDESCEFCEEIVSEMCRRFDLDSKEAVGRINRLWSGNDFLGKDDIRYHEDEEFWAQDIYYGHDSYWWNHPPNLKPLPYP